MRGVVVELVGHDDVERDEQRAGIARRARGCPGPCTRTVLPRLRARRHLHRDRRVERRHLHLRAERGLGERDRHLHREVGLAAAGEDRVRRDVHDDVEVAGRAAVEPGRARALHPDALAVVDAGGDPHLHRARAHLDAAALAVLALVLDDAAAPTAGGTHLRERERALVDATDAGAATVGQRSGSVPGLAPVPSHTEHGASDVMFTDVVMPWTASRKSRCSSVSRSCPRWGPTGPAPRPPPAARAAAEQVAEDVAEAAEVAEVLEADVPEAAATGTRRNHRTRRDRRGRRPDATISRTSSYSLRFSASPSTSLRGGDLLEALLGRPCRRRWRRGGTAWPASGRRA